MHYGLTGQQSLEILRFRSFASGDIGRINVQQQFLTAVVEQILANRSSLASLSNLTALADIAFNEVNTDIDSAFHLLWFAQRFFELEPENITFATTPHVMNDFIVNRGYVVIVLDEWLEMLNEMLNPFSVDKTASDVSILSRGADRRLFSSDGNWAGGNASWGSGSRGPAQPQGGGAELAVTGGGGNAGGGTGGGNAGGGGTQTPAPPQTGSVVTADNYPTDDEEPEYPTQHHNQQLPGTDTPQEQTPQEQVHGEGEDGQASHEPPEDYFYPQEPGDTQPPEYPSDPTGEPPITTEPPYTQEPPAESPPETPAPAEESIQSTAQNLNTEPPPQTLASYDVAQ